MTMENTNTIQAVPLKQIYESGSNPRRTMDTEAIKDLAENIRIHGLLNPLLVRPGKKNGYELVAGHRRFNALKLLSLTEINCIVRKLNDEEAFELAVIENLQREDVHPLDEAQAFETILKKVSIEDLAKKINKSASYIARRVKLNDLTKQAKELFSKGDITLAHCIQLCRLDPSDQTEALESIKDREHYDGKYKDVYGSPIALTVYIDRQILVKLYSAPFKKEDVTILPKAGSCTACPKRTGANKTLFNDLQKDDCCLDRNCYNQKIQNHVFRNIHDTMNDGHNVVLIEDAYLYDNAKKVFLDEFKGIKIHPDYNVRIIKKEEKDSIKGVFISGDKIGKVVDVKSSKSASDTQTSRGLVSSSELSPKEQIAKTEDRLARSVEIDRGRLGAKLSNILNSIAFFSDKKLIPNQPEISILEKELFYYSLYQTGGYGFKSIFNKVLIPGIDGSYRSDEKNNIREKLRSITADQERQIMRVFIKMHIFDINMQLLEKDVYRTQAFKDICDQYKEDETDKILLEQQAIREKREKNAAAKIEALQKEIKAAVKTNPKSSSKSKSKKS